VRTRARANAACAMRARPHVKPRRSSACARPKWWSHRPASSASICDGPPLQRSRTRRQSALARARGVFRRGRGDHDDRSRAKNGGVCMARGRASLRRRRHRERFGHDQPSMATMLSFVVTDAPMSRAGLQAALREACDGSFNMISVDGDMSTNDSCYAFARPGRRAQRPASARRFRRCAAISPWRWCAMVRVRRRRSYST